MRLCDGSPYETSSGSLPSMWEWARFPSWMWAAIYEAGAVVGSSERLEGRKRGTVPTNVAGPFHLKGENR